MKRLGIGVLGLVLIIGMAGAGLYGYTSTHLRRTYDIKVETVAVPSDAAAIERGKRFASVIAKCTDCHAANLQGQVMVDDPAFARLASANLTSGKGGVASQYKTDADWVRSIRHGVAPDGRALIFMPSESYNEINDADLGDLIAYLKSLPPQNNELPKPRMGPIARGLYASGKLPLLPAEKIDHDAPRPAAVPAGATVEYGKYLSVVGGCTGCHRKNLAGGPDAAAPPGSAEPANLTPTGLGSWSEQDFFTALRTGKRPDGKVLDSFMPWAMTAQMTDDEIRALWLYLKTLPPTPTNP
jgi:cytochrome c553